MERSISSLTKRSHRMRKVAVLLPKRSATGMLVTCASDETIRHRGPFFVPLGSLFSTHLETSSLISDERLQVETYARRSWPLRSEHS